MMVLKAETPALQEKCTWKHPHTKNSLAISPFAAPMRKGNQSKAEFVSGPQVTVCVNVIQDSFFTPPGDMEASKGTWNQAEETVCHKLHPWFQ